MKWEWQKIFTYEEIRWENNNEDEWGDLLVPVKANQVRVKLDGGLFSDTLLWSSSSSVSNIITIATKYKL